MTAAERALFNKIHFGGWPTPDLPATAARSYSDGRSTTAECEAALADCLDKGWLQIIDKAALTAISDDVRAAGLIGPIYRLPDIGDVDFTPLGAAIWLSLYHPLEASTTAFAYQVEMAVHLKSSHYFRTKPAALATISWIQADESVCSIRGPFEIGPWRAQWWRRFLDGYRIDVEANGNYAYGSTHHLSKLDQPPAELQRLQHILDRYNVTLIQWLSLAAMDTAGIKYSSRLPKSIAESAGKRFGGSTSEEECRAALQDCVRLGWLMIVDIETADTIREQSEREDQIKALLGEEPAIMTIDQQPWVRTTIHFTPPGAALYRMIAAEWLGPAWEDEIHVSVSQETYREEHRYCETEEGLRAVLREYAARDEKVRASKVVPIGPWCVQWWKRFPRGYRLELQLGDPYAISQSRSNTVRD
jgi:hypothetical protein